MANYYIRDAAHAAAILGEYRRFHGLLLIFRQRLPLFAWQAPAFFHLRRRIDPNVSPDDRVGKNHPADCQLNTNAVGAAPLRLKTLDVVSHVHRLDLRRPARKRLFQTLHSVAVYPPG